MKVTEIETAAGYAVAATVFEAERSNTLLVIASATGVKQSFYRKFSEFISAGGITVITFDYRGIGQSLKEPIVTLRNNASDWGKTDLEAVIRYTKEQHPESKIILLGHSIGGQLVGLAPSSPEAQKIILVAAQTGYWKLWNGLGKYRMWVNWRILFPLLTNLFGYLPSKKISGMENLPRNVAKQWTTWCTDPNYFFGSIPEKDLYFDHITVPVLSVSIENDPFAPQQAVDWLTARFSRANSRRIHLRPEDFNTYKIGHFDIFREKFKDTIWKWLLDEIIK